MSKFSEVVDFPSLEEAVRRAFPTMSECIDGRDATRLAMFVKAEDFHLLGLEIKKDAIHEPIEWNVANVEAQVETDVDFAFEKALNKRGISASLMHEVLLMWFRILEPKFEVPSYTQYGLPLCKAMAIYYGFENQIGDDIGNEYKYSAEAEY